MPSVNYKLFQDCLSNWEPLLREAAAFASQLGPDRVINITTHENRFTLRPTVVVTVWYWEEESE
jgi:hypothetical protein